MDWESYGLFAAPNSFEARKLTQIYRKPFKYYTRLKGHFGCVNALKFNGSDGGRILASGGDDLRVLLWDSFGIPHSKTEPVKEFKGYHNNNIFCIAFDPDATHMVSTGLDGLVVRYDVEKTQSLGNSSMSSSSSSSTADVFRDHQGPVFKVDFKPDDSNVAITAGGDDTLRLWDWRSPPACTGILDSEYTVSQQGIAFNPVAPNLFVAGGAEGTLALYDLRKCFSSGNDVPLLLYNTAITRNLKKRVLPSITHVAFHPTGKFILSSPLCYLPTLYALQNPDPLVVFHSSDFKNSCTMKNFAFGGSPEDSNASHVLAGSDYNRGYMWRIPTFILHGNEDRIAKADAFEQYGLDGSPYNGLTYERNGNPIPVRFVDEPDQVFTGYRSNVNSIISHPSLPYIFGAGVPKAITVHCPYPLEPLDEKGEQKAELISDRLNSADENEVEEDVRTLIMFQLLNEEERDFTTML